MKKTKRNTKNVKRSKFGLFLSFLLLFFFYGLQAQTVSSWLTTGDKSKLIEQQANVTFVNNSGSSASTITVDPNTTFQTMDGFGWCLTQGSAQVISGLASTQQNTLLNDLFNPSTGLSSSVVRISIGASDLSNSTYSYNETAGDVNMNNFSLNGPDLTYLIPILKKILLINPNIKILATPWSAPIWMKTNNSFIGGNLQTQYYAAYAKYFVKYFTAMQSQGIPIWAITPQNEPGNANNEPSMLMNSIEEKNFINQQLGPQMATAGFGNIKIIAYDHNCDLPSYPIDVLNNSTYVDGAAFHLYAGDISAMSQVHDQTNKNIYFTEQYTGAGGDFSGDFGYHMKNVIIGSVNNWAKTAIEWNLAADSNLGPRTLGGCTSCLPAVTINNSTSYTKNVSYYIIGQISKFAKVGALRLSSNSTNSTIYSAGFKNTDGSVALLVYNSGAVASVKIVQGSKAFTYSIPAASAITFDWSNGPAVAVNAVSVSPTGLNVSVNGTGQLNATVAPSNASNTNVTWSSNNTAVATVNTNGLVSGIAAGSAVITVKTTDGNKTVTANVTVTSVAVTGVSVSAGNSFFITQTQQLTDTVAPANASNKSVSWTSSNSNVATVNNSGLVTAVNPGTTTITVKTTDSNWTASTTVTVNGQQAYTGTPINLPGIVEAENFDKGGQNISYYDTDASNNGGQYRTTEAVDIAQISGTNGYTVGWTADGEWLEYTVNVTAGSYSIIASAASPNSGKQLMVKLDGNILTTINIPNTSSYGTFQNVTIPNVNFSGGNNKILRFEIVGGEFNLDKVEIKSVINIPVNNVVVSPNTLNLSSGSTSQLSATVSPSNATNKTVIWSSSNNAVASVDTTGLVAAIKVGNATITVTTQDGNKTSNCAITVTASSTSTFPGYYNIFSKNSGKGLDVADNSSSSGSRIQQYEISNGGGTNQRWKFIDAGNGNFYIIVKSTQFYLTPENNRTSNGTKIVQKSFENNETFKWQITSLGGGFYKIINVGNGLSLDVEGFSTSNGANIQLWTYQGNDNQKWSFNQVETNTNLSSLSQSNSPVLNNLEISDDNLKVYPNPSINYLNVDSKHLLDGKIEVITLNGQIIIKQNSSSNHALVDISSLPSGIYIIKVSSANQFYLKKFIKK